MRRAGLGAAALLLFAVSHRPNRPAADSNRLRRAAGAAPAEGKRWMPVLNWSVANEPWTKGQTPKAASGLQAAAFAQAGHQTRGCPLRVQNYQPTRGGPSV